MPTLQEIRDDRLKRDNAITPNERPSSVAVIDRSERVFDLSIKKNMPKDAADAEVLIDEVVGFSRTLTDSPFYKNVDGLLDVFDPSEPPPGTGGLQDPFSELAGLELAVAGSLINAARPVASVGLKMMGYIFSPIDRAFKFATNATMFEPFTKSVAGPIRRQIIIDLENTEVRKRLVPEREKLRVELLKKHKGAGKVVFATNTTAFQREFGKRILEIEAGIREQVQKDLSGIKETEEKAIGELPKVDAGDFGKSAVDALKALVPWPGFADDVKSRGEISADSFERIVGRDAPWYYSTITDIAEQTVALGGLMKIARSSQSIEGLKDASLIAKGAKLTKAEVRAIKRLHKAASQVKKVTIRAEGVPSSTEAAVVTQKLIRLLKNAKSKRPEKALLVHQNRQRQARKLVQVQKSVQGRKLVKATKGALKGKSAAPDFTPLNVDLSGMEIDTLYNVINTSQLGEGFARGRAVLSLDKLMSGTLITKSEIANLELVFGKGLTKAWFGKQSISSIIQDISFEVINFPRAVLASYDLSAAGRQGIIFSISHPIASTKAFGRSIRAAASLKYSDEIERVTRSTKFSKLADKFGVHSSPTGFAANISAKEEVYMSRLAERVPGIAQSERAFTTFLNQQRREVFAIHAKNWIQQGITPSNDPKSYQQLAAFVNHATGRGSMENLQPGALTALNAIFFSPRFQVSRVQVIGDLISPRTTIQARKVIARDLAKFYATGMGVLGMMAAGGADVEIDPRSSDFGKIQVGNTRYNYWGGFQPIATFVGRVYIGEIKSTGTEKIKKKGRGKIIGAFLRTKLAPVPGRGIDVLLGETLLGDPVEPTLEFAKKTAFESLVPLFIQDVADAWKFQGVDAQFPISAILAFTGIGVQTWELAPFAELELARDSLARQTYGKNYDNLSFSEVSMLDRDILVNHPGIVALEREVKFESDGVRFQMKIAQDERKSERFITKRIDKDLAADLNEIKLSIGGVSRTFGNWRLNDAQYKEYQERVAKNINDLFLESKPLWDTKDAEGKYELMHALLRSAKLLAANEMRIGDIE